MLLRHLTNLSTDRETMKILVSACLLGINCKYNGGNNLSPEVAALKDKHDLVPVCPECLGGLPSPRVPAEIVEGIVTNKDGVNVDAQFRKGAFAALEIAKENRIDLAILQSRSPSCGVGRIYDGTFSGILTEGDGVFADLLKKEGYKVIDVEDSPTLKSLLR